MASGGVRPDLEALLELEEVLRLLESELAGWRRRALAAEAKAAELGRALGINLDPVFFVFGDVVAFINGLDRTFWNTGAAVYADIWIYVQHFIVIVKTGNGAYRYTISKAATFAVISYYGCHVFLLT